METSPGIGHAAILDQVNLVCGGLTEQISSILALRVNASTVKEARTECDSRVWADADAATRLARADGYPGLLRVREAD